MDAERSAVISGDTRSVVSASRSVAAIAFAQLAALRVLAGSHQQAVELYRRSLALEDSNPVRAALAASAFSAGDSDEVIAQTAKLLETNPKSSELWLLNAKAWMAKRDYKSAIESLNHSLELRKDVNAQYSLLYSYLKLKNIERAKTVMQSILTEQGNQAIWHVVFGGAYSETGFGEEAVAEFRRALTMGSNVPKLHLYYAVALLNANGWAPSIESMKELRLALKEDPKDLYANLYLGLQEAQTDQLEESNKHLHLAAETDPTIADAWLYLGLNAFKTKDYPNAKTYLLKAIEQTGTNESPGNYEIRRAYAALSRIEFNDGNKELSARYSEKFKDLKNKAMADQAAGISELASGMGPTPGVVPHDKLPTRESMVTAAPVNMAAPTALPKSSLSAAEQERIKNSEQELRTVLATAFNDWGTADAREGLYPIALEHFREAEQWDSSTPGVARNVGLAALKIGDVNEAIRGFRVAIEVDPKDRLSHARLAMLLFNQNDYKGAAAQFDILGDAAYVDSAVAYAYAYSLAQLNQQKRAIEVLNRLSTMQMPAELLLSVGDLYSVLQDYEDALLRYRKALELEPGIPKAHYKMGAALIRLSRPAEAIPELQTELNATPDDPDVQFNLAYALLSTSQKEKATVILRKITAQHPDYSAAQYELGKSLLEDSKVDEAITHLEVAAKLDTESDYVHYQLQSAYRRAGRKEEADREAQIYKDIKARKREQATIPMPQGKP